MKAIPLMQYIERLKCDKRYDQDLWRFCYEAHPYLVDTPDETLDYRYETLCKNIAHLVNDLRHDIPRQLPFLSSWWWLSLYEHIQFEYETRKRKFPSCDLVAPLSPIWPESFRPKGPNSNDYLVRYSQLRYLKETMLTGRLIFWPATKYRSKGLDVARYDNELEMNCFLPGRLTTITTQDGHKIPIIGELKKTRSTATDYNILCFSNEFDSRLFSDFESNASLVIWDIVEFERRVSIVLRLSGLPFELYPLQVLYFDPRNVLAKQLVAPGSCKDFEFAYQREYRFILQPKGLIKQSSRIELNVGPLEDIAGLYSADGRFLGLGCERNTFFQQNS